ncbi:MAG: hypothetical protein KA347_03850 [Bacteroidia bacterium]|nr:hypothetical protein [Bacteroidia bacterium]
MIHMKSYSKIILLLVILTTLSTSCSKNNSSNSIYFITFDDLSGYIDNSTIKINNLAYSGNKCVQLNKEFLYGPTFSKKFNEIKPGIINKLIVSGWVKSDSKNGSMQLVCSIDSVDKTVFWNSIDSKTLTGNNDEWKQMSITFDLTKVNNGNNKLNIYPMHAGEGNSYLDDLEFSFE